MIVAWIRWWQWWHNRWDVTYIDAWLVLTHDSLSTAHDWWVTSGRMWIGLVEMSNCISIYLTSLPAFHPIPAAFKQQAHLDTHLRIHTGVRPFKCSMPSCERTFTQLANLQYHIRNHDSQLKRAAASMRERVRCPICFKAYDSNPALERHMYEFHKIYDRPRNW